MKLSGWGRFPWVETQRLHPRSVEDLQAMVRQDGPLIARGAGRSYGDAAVSHGRTISLTGMAAIGSLDETRGLLTCDAGAMLGDILAHVVPRGWFPYVTPGTQFVTVGGMIASNVHGKNHHRDGSFCRYVTSLDLLLGDGTMITCTPEVNAPLFRATCGGMGLTGIIVRATLRLRPIQTSFIRQTILVSHDLRQTWERLQEAEGATYSVAWIDCLAQDARRGRSVLFLGEHADKDDVPDKNADDGARLKRRLSIPGAAPDWLLSPTTVRAFNAYYFAKHARKRTPACVSLQSFFYPLDSVGDWNNLYGRRGFVQFQCVLPPTTAFAAIADMLSYVSTSGVSPFLAVLKRMRSDDEGLLGFPMEGYTLAMDLPLRERTLAAFDVLQRVTMQAGGRQYLTKDALMSRAALAAGYGERLAQFRAIRAGIPGADRMESALARRLGFQDG